MNKKKILIVVVAVIVIIVVYSIISLSNKGSQVNNQSNITLQNTDIGVAQSDGIVINKNDINNTAKFYKYTSGNIDMEVMAVKSSDGNIRTALNTCQICYDSGRGYYKQEGDYMVCQNCGNRFNLNQIEKIKGGCNPVPILAQNKTDNGDTIIISKEYLDSQKSYFENWKN
jgi:uncharacterized membrane protein